MLVVCEELFAPVVSLIAYNDLDEAIESGIGHEGPKYVIQEMTESKLVLFKLK